MRRVFADTLYWVALIHRKDQWHAAALRVSHTLTSCHLVMTDEVLIEVLGAFCEAGPVLRQRAAALVRRLYQRSTVTVHPQSRGSFLAGLTLYEARPDKGYSLTDCISMQTMLQEGITDILTRDAHFTQEGFTILL
jgi:predicted nucleic acid-binding protein